MGLGFAIRCTKEYYLHTLVLPTLLRHADAKLSANGQDLGGEVPLGFSGFPGENAVKLVTNSTGGRVPWWSKNVAPADEV